VSEQNFDIDSAQAAYEAARQGSTQDPEQSSQSVLPPEVGSDVSPADPALDPDAITVDELTPEEVPPGFLSYEDYVAQGGDPEMYRGPKAFVAEHDRIEENKQLRRELKETQTMVKTTMDAVQDWQTTERGRLKAEVEAELNEAFENEDPKAAVAAQKKLDELESAPAPAAPQGEHPAIQDFREKNPLIDQASDRFNAEFNADVEAIYNTTAQALSLNGSRKLTEGQINRALNKALKDAQALHGDLFESPRNERRTPGSTPPGRREAPREAAPRAESYVIDNPRNPNQGNAAADIRETIRKEAVKQATKTGKSAEDAEKAGKAAAERFERSLMS